MTFDLFVRQWSEVGLAVALRAAMLDRRAVERMKFKRSDLGVVGQMLPREKKR